MTDKTPPFSALRAVEAASRHKSFTWAAKELNITHSAVSQSIRRLESDLGAKLFERRGGAMQPSEAALKLAQSYADAAQSLGQAIRDISGDPSASAISLALEPAFAKLWFAGRLSRLGEAMPDVRVEVVTGRNPETVVDAELVTDTRLEGSDRLLAEIGAHPACTPALAAKSATPEQILTRPLVADNAKAWPAWAAKLVPGAPTPRVHLFDDVETALESAAHGGGVALADQFTLEPYVESGRLICLPFVVPTGRKLAFRSRQGGAKGEMTERLFMWFKLEIARSAAHLRERQARVGTT